MYDGTPCTVVPGVARDWRGYGWCNVTRYGLRVQTRHRLAWIDAHGCLPPDDRPHVLHHCDHPPCENPAHLYAGTYADNARDMTDRGRRAPARVNRSSRVPNDHRTRGEGHHTSVLTEDVVRDIRERAARGESRQAIADAVGFARSTVQDVASRRTWAHVI